MSSGPSRRPGRCEPPTAATFLVRAFLPLADQAEVLGDLEEAFVSHADVRGLRRAKLWYWNESAHFVVRAVGSILLAPVAALADSEFLVEFRLGRRVFRNAPFFSAVVVLILALGVGATTAMFDTVRLTLLEPLPFSDPSELVLGRATFNGNLNPYASGADYIDYAERVDAFNSLAAIMPFGQDHTVTGTGEPERITGVAVSTNFFQTLGVPPLAGRSFVEADGLARAAQVVIIGHGHWVRRYGGDPAAVGSPLTIDGEPHTIVGVAAAGFALFDQGDFYRPLRPDRDGAAERIYHNWMLVGRLRDGVSLDRAQAQADVVSGQLAEAYPESNANKSLLLSPLHATLVEDYQSNLLLLLGAVGLMLLIAAGNAAGMFLARTPARRTELAVRAALGAPRARLVSQLLSESIWLATVAGVFGIAVALLMERVVMDLLALDLPGLGDPALSPPVMAIAFCLSLLTGIIAGVYPAIAGSDRDLNADLKTGRAIDRGGARFRGFLVGSQVAVSVALLIGSGLLLASLRSAAEVDPGFATDRLVTAEIELPRSRYSSPGQVMDFYARLATDAASINTVEGVTLANNLPLRNPGNWYPVWANEDAKPEQSFAYRAVLPGYFETMEIPTLTGRQFTETDVRDATPVALLSEGAAALLFPEGDALGHTVFLGWFDRSFPMEVAGVVGDVRVTDLESTPEFAIYVPMAQRPTTRVRVAVRFSGESAPVIAGLRDVLARLDGDVPLADAATMDDVVSDLLAVRRSVLTALSIYAFLPLIMAAVGLYALLVYDVRLRSREIGIRLVLGASPANLGKSIVRHGLWLSAVGVGVGLLGGFGLSRTMRGFLFGVEYDDPTTFVLVAAGVLLLTAASTAIPAWRAVQTDPAESLRVEA